MVLHELAHGYHHQFQDGGVDNAAVKAAWDDSIKANRYDSVERIPWKEAKGLHNHEPDGVDRRDQRGVFRQERLLPLHPPGTEAPRPGHVRIAREALD